MLRRQPRAGMRRPVKVLLATAAASVATISVGTAGWAATSTPQPVVLMTPPVLIGSALGDTIACTVANGSATPITVDVAILGDDRVVVLEGGSITLNAGASASISEPIEPTTTGHPDKCRFTTTTPAAVRAGVIANGALGTQTFAAEPLPIITTK